MILGPDNRIVSATRKELMSIWQTQELYEVMSFDDYEFYMQHRGVTIEPEE